MKAHLGFDIGSTFTKLCVMSDTREIISLITFPTPVAQKEYFKNYISNITKQYTVQSIVSCGYGKENVEAEKSISELTALAKGMGMLFPNIHTVLDIGGQDCKVVQCDEGKLKRFFMNDKCAAGSGLFLQNALRILDMSFDELELNTDTVTPLSTVCAVFAQTEIIRRISNGASKSDLSNSVIYSILKQAAGLVYKVKHEKTIAFTGGIAIVPGADRHLANILGCDIFVPENCTYLSAIGCAYTGAERLV